MNKFNVGLCAILVIATVFLVLPFTGNRTIIDTTYKYNKAIIKMPDDTVKEINISSWKDYEGEQIQLKDKDGTIYLVNSINCVLIND